MKDLDKWDVIATLIGLFAWFRGEKGRTVTDGGEKDQKQKIVSILQGFFSKVDESMWLSLITQLDEKQKQAITRLLKSLNRSRERDSFCLTVVNAPVATTVVEVPDPSDKTGKRKIKRVVKVGEYSGEDTRVVFLKDIAILVDDPEWGPKAVRDMLRTHELATENKVAKHALRIWKGFLFEMNKMVCEFFGVHSIGEITTGMVAEQLNALADKIPERVGALNQGFWSRMLERHPYQAAVLGGMTIVVLVIFNILTYSKEGGY